MKHFRLLALTAAALLATACTTASLKELRHAEMKGTPFQSALAKLYLEFSESEAAQYDWRSSKHFADKGLMAAYGNDVPPELVENWDLPADKIPELTTARETVVAFLSSPVGKAQPQKAARAQYYFDCWVEQQTEDWQSDDIAACREGLRKVLSSVGMGTTLPGATEDVMTPLPYEADAPVATGEPVVLQQPAPQPLAAPVVLADTAPKATPKPLAAPTLSTSYLVFFGMDSTSLNNDGKKVISTVIRDLDNIPNYQVVLNGHSDASGSAQENMDVSQKRIDAVRKALVAGGVDSKRIQGFAFGETDPRTPTSDDRPEASNRRVEIFINP